MDTMNQNIIFLGGENFFGLLFFVTRVNRIITDIASAITPPSFDGIDRRITYANRKYHSGWICTGATSGLAGLKFSTSPSMFGLFEEIIIIISIIIIIGMESFTENMGLNFTLSMLDWSVDGLDDPFSCNRIMWIIAKTVITIGRRKWSEKNRFNVGCDTDGPPQIHVTNSFPTMGIADRTPVITVAPQKDIWPQGRTYPRNAVAITISIIITPDTHTLFLFAGEEK